MIQAGQTVENPVTGERMIFRKTAADTGGELVEFELVAKPGAFVAMPHVHPYQTERFEVLSGTLEVKKGRKRETATVGQVVEIEPGVSHSWRNASDEEELRFLVEVRPALQFERLIETMFGLAADGKTNKKGMPNPLRMALIARKHFDDARLPVLPGWVQRAMVGAGAALGKLAGYEATYEPSGDAALAL
ncbi:MAG TPA: cupin domain-containing protein [Gaiellaceae bacterium]|jgi:quercetin dioxygenase-like cupin family protein|nr:cupin domain-containing protein [Gaiellaceae bacterium]